MNAHVISNQFSHHAFIDRVPYFYNKLKVPLSYFYSNMANLIILRQPAITVTVFSKPTKLTNDLSLVDKIDLPAI